MTQARMTEILSETIRVTSEEARAALEASKWSLPDAALLLQKARARARRAEAAQACREGDARKLVDAVRRVIAGIRRSSLQARRSTPVMAELSAATLVPLMVAPSGYVCRCW